MNAREVVERDPMYSAFRHAHRLIRAAGMSQAMACYTASIKERDYMRLASEYERLPPLKRSNARPHEEYGDTTPPSCLSGLVRTTKSPDPLPADWTPPSRQESRRIPMEDDMGKSRGRPPWRRGDPGLTPDDELAELTREVEVPVDEGELEDAAAAENTEDEQDQMARGEWEEPATSVLRDPFHPFELPAQDLGAATGPIPGLQPTPPAPDVAEAWCRSPLEYQGVNYTCIKPAHSPLVAHEYASDPAQHEDSPVEEVVLEPDLPVEEPTPLPEPEVPEDMAAAMYEPPAPTEEEVEAQKEKGIEQLEHKLEEPAKPPKPFMGQRSSQKDPMEFWRKNELPGYVELVKQGYNPHTSVHFRRLTPAQLDAVKHAARH